jgi:hypothetical protein
MRREQGLGGDAGPLSRGRAKAHSFIGAGRQGAHLGPSHGAGHAYFSVMIRPRAFARPIHRAAVLGLGVTLAGCREATAPVSPLAGIYLLTFVDGERLPQNRPLAAVSGFIELTATGGATRRITYLHRQTNTPVELTSRGSFVAEANGVRLTLHDDGAPADAIWRPFAEVNEHVMTLRYPRAAELDIVEVYVRNH